MHQLPDNPLIILDTSACIESLRATESPVDLTVNRLIGSRGAAKVAICGPTWTELLAGFRRARREHIVWLRSIQYVPLEDPLDFSHAAVLYRRARAAGITIRSMLDCIVAAVAIRCKAPLLHRDRDFTHLARISPLKLADPESVA